MKRVLQIKESFSTTREQRKSMGNMQSGHAVKNQTGQISNHGHLRERRIPGSRR